MKEGKLWMYIIYKWTKVGLLSLLSTLADYNYFLFIAPTLAEIRLNLLDAKTSTSGIQGSVTWLIEGFSIEDAQ
jgi:hypothetical protein